MNARWMGTDVDQAEVLTQPGDVGVGAENYQFDLMVRCPVCDRLHLVTIAQAANRWKFDHATMTLTPSVLASAGDRGTCHWNLTNGQFIIHPDSNARKATADE